MAKNLENDTRKMRVKERKLFYDGSQERDSELERMVGNLFVSEFQISRLGDRLTNDGVPTRTITMFLGHSPPKEESEFTFKCKNNGKVCRVSISIHRMNRTDDDNGHTV
jgi:hypothetical protein